MAKPEIPARLENDLIDRVRGRFEDLSLVEGWELKIDALAPGAAMLLLGDTNKVHNDAGKVHGGVLAALGDMACALALSTVFDGQLPFATSDLHIRYLEPTEGMVYAEAEVLRLSSRGAVLECRMRCKGRIVALCTTHFTIRAAKRN